MRRAFFLLVAFGSAGAGCSQASLPPGTPPPEYEMRPVEPWPPASAATPAPPAEAEALEPAPAPAELPSDAGPEATDAAPETHDAAPDVAPKTGPF